MKTFALLSFALAGFFISLMTPGAIAQVGIKPDAKIGEKVFQALEERSEVRVVVALSEPEAARARPVQLAKLRDDVSKLQTAVQSRLAEKDFKVLHKFQAAPALVGLATAEGVQRLAADINVAKIDLDEGGRGGLADTVPLIHADKWRALGVTGRNVVVAVLDSGVDSDHNDLSDNLIHQECFLDTDGFINGIGHCPNGSDRQSGVGAAEDDFGHGTSVTGIITSRGVVSSVGVAPDAKIVAVKVLDSGNRFYYFSEIVTALDYILNSRPDVRVINMSLGTDALFSGYCDNATASTMAASSIINSLRNRANNPVVTFASSMNNGSGTQMAVPACLQNVISVGATTKSDVVASFTNSNSTLDLMAPGVNVTSDWLGNGLNTVSGTSFASPHAAACTALLLQWDPTLTPSQIEARLKVSPVSVTDPKNGLSFPRLDCSPPETPAVKALTLNPTSVTGGKTSTATVTLDKAAPARDTVVQLLSSNTSAATTPASITITAGLTSKTFTVTTQAVPMSKMVDISASAGGMTRTAHLSVAPPVLTGLTLSPASIAAPCQTSVGRVTLNGTAPAGGVQINITKTTSAVTVPSSVLVPAGATYKTFTISAPTRVTARTNSVITAQPANANFGVTGYSKTLTVLPIGVKTLVMPASATGPTTITATVTLACVAPAEGQMVILSTNNAAVARPTLNGTPISSITIAQGRTTATFKVTVADVSAVSYATITAKANGIYQSVRLTVNP
jgi:subtilisin family serine protease